MHEHNHHHHHHHGGGALGAFTMPALSGLLLLAGIIMSHIRVSFFDARGVELAWYIVAFLPVGLPVMKEAVAGLRKKDFFNEFTLMVIACIGAFCIGEYPEAVGVMLFYSIGETLQHGAVDRATADISRLIDVRGESATVVRNGKLCRVKPEEVRVGETIEVGPGSRVPLDGVLEGTDALFDTSALTGESVPRDIAKGGEVLAGMISLQSAVSIRVTRPFSDSALSRILCMVSEASDRKAHAELFIRKFARIYTPVVILLSLLVVVVPAIVGLFNPAFHYDFSTWLYRALVFLVISCPCALVISVPLGYYAGIGAASRAGILFKGGNYLEEITRINAVAFDKTGTLTTGRFSVGRVIPSGMTADRLLGLMAAVESCSTHPLARALVDYVKSKGIEIPKAESLTDKAGKGASGTVGGSEVMAGSVRMLREAGIVCPAEIDSEGNSVIACSVDGKFAGYVALSDTPKPDAAEAVADLRKLGINDIVMLSGDREAAVADMARRLGITQFHGAMLPADKAEFVENLSRKEGRKTAFVGDGMNDAPVLAISDVGIAMGGLGSDAAIESADVVIQTDSPSRVATAIRIGRYTRRIVMQNIVGAIGVKVVVLILGAAGYASLWAAVFADVGVALLAVLNSMRILRYHGQAASPR